MSEINDLKKQLDWHRQTIRELRNDSSYETELKATLAEKAKTIEAHEQTIKILEFANKEFAEDITKFNNICVNKTRKLNAIVTAQAKRIEDLETALEKIEKIADKSLGPNPIYCYPTSDFKKIAEQAREGTK